MNVKQRAVFTATQWWKHGDHPKVENIPERLKRFRPAETGARGYIVQELESNGIFVFPGDWIVESEMGYITTFSEKEFKERFEEAGVVK